MYNLCFFFPVRSKQVRIERVYKLNCHKKKRFKVDELFGFYQNPVRARAVEEVEEDTKKVHQHLFYCSSQLESLAPLAATHSFPLLCLIQCIVSSVFYFFFFSLIVVVL